MGENSAIEWTDHTFNPWWGCERISPACDKCYAASFAHRLGMDGLWSGERRTFGAAHWAQPFAWNRKAGKASKRARVFCASMADVFDNQAPQAQRERLWRLIEATEHLDWLLLTKRIGNAERMLPAAWLESPRPNVWLGATIANQEEADRDIPKLLRVPAAVRFLSCEPLLGPISFVGRWVEHRNVAIHENWLEALDWVIVGGESGHNARPMSHEWAADLRGQCAAVDTPFFMKQGSQANWPRFKDFESFPDDIRVREWPRSAHAVSEGPHG